MTDGASMDWQLALTAAGAIPDASGLVDTLDWIAAPVPGSVALALQQAGRWQPGQSLALHHQDVWYRGKSTTSGRFTLVGDGLATLAEVYVGGALVGKGANAFIHYPFDAELTSGDEIAICFRALAPSLAQRGSRAGWRVPMIPAPGLRLVRTPMLAHMPGWSPEIDIVGPLRGVTLLAEGQLDRRDVRLSVQLADGVGHVEAHVAAGCDALRLVVGSETAAFVSDGETRVARLTITDPELWWPNGCGPQSLYPASVETEFGLVALGSIGFRTIEADRSGDGFGLIVNGKPVFSRGACWTSNDIIGHAATREAYAPWLRLAAEAGMTMIRVGGTMIPPARAFFDLCDELGLMVWQEFAFANFDYPVGDPAFAADVTAEGASLLAEIGAAPSLAVLCGGSEVIQQAAMMGLPPERWPGPLYDVILKDAAAKARPDVPYVPNSPSGGALPFLPNRGIAHYYGVGAYMRPLEDARRAEVTFAAECLAFSNVPDNETLVAHLPYPAHDPRWKARVPRDLSASWDFEDVREHYLGLIFGVDPQKLRRENAGLHTDLSRVVTGHVMAETFAEWRRGRSPTKGALVWTLQDLLPGAGWGVIDSTGRPKAAWYALKRALRPVQVTITDEGTNGLAVHLINETGSDIAARLTLTAYRDGITPVIAREREVTLDAFSNSEINAFELIGAFFDVSYAYRFGPPGHDLTVARLIDASTGGVIAEAMHHPLGLGHPWPKPVINARVEGDELVLTASSYAPFVHIEAGQRRPADDWFALLPGIDKRVTLIGEGAMSGFVATPGGAVHVSFAG